MSKTVWINTDGLLPRFERMGIVNMRVLLEMIINSDDKGRVWSRYKAKHIMNSDYTTITTLPECQGVASPSVCLESGLPFIQLNPRYVMFYDPAGYGRNDALATAYDKMTKDFLRNVLEKGLVLRKGYGFDGCDRAACFTYRVQEFSRRLKRDEFINGNSRDASRCVWINADAFEKQMADVKPAYYGEVIDAMLLADEDGCIEPYKFEFYDGYLYDTGIMQAAEKSGFVWACGMDQLKDKRIRECIQIDPRTVLFKPPHDESAYLKIPFSKLKPADDGRYHPLPLTAENFTNYLAALAVEDK